MRAASLNAVDDERIDGSFRKGFREFNRKVPAETCLLCWVQSSLLSWVHCLNGGRVGVLREIGSLFSKVGKGESKTLVFCWGNCYADCIIRSLAVHTQV